MSNDNIDSKFLGRLQSGIRTVLQWENDASFLKLVRDSIPFEIIFPSTTIWDDKQRFNVSEIPSCKFNRKDDFKYRDDDLFLKRLTFYFQKEVMNWVNNPVCSFCGSKETVSIGVRGAETNEEKEGKASRVEVYNCTMCNATTTFPRYNCPKAIFREKKGRCGEYANLFGVYCRAVGFDQVRYILDATDHVWVEVYSLFSRRYIMADSCEGLIDRDSMYEKGWNKKLSYILAFSVVIPNNRSVQVVDVTKRYTRKFNSADFQSRRRMISTSETVAKKMIEQGNSYVQYLTEYNKLVKNMMFREKQELYFFEQTLTSDWSMTNVTGRISGNVGWKTSRNELGTGSNSRNDDSFETFLNYFSFNSEVLKITLTSCKSISWPFKNAIVICGVPCAVGSPGYNIVVINECNGCILSSTHVSNSILAIDYLKTLNKKRIIAIVHLSQNKQNNNKKKEIDPNMKEEDEYIIYKLKQGKLNAFVGQIQNYPHRTSLEEEGQIYVEFCLKGTKSDIVLNQIPKIIPSKVSNRLLGASLQEQQVFSLEQKKTLFLKQKLPLDVGFITKKDYPIYVFDKSAFPFETCADMRVSKGNDWETYHLLPKEILDDKEKPREKIIHTPVNFEFFQNLLGPTLINNDVGTIPINFSLKNKRLVAFYVSAHWCPPCKQFTPMLAEFYLEVKSCQGLEHALEIVFISSDRDETSFNHYFKSMPWLALPFFCRDKKALLGSKFDIRGIPALVVMDSISGHVVSHQARQEVMQACSSGNIQTLISTWLSSIPDDSQILMQTLEFSIQEEEKIEENENEKEEIVVYESYLPSFVVVCMKAASFNDNQINKKYAFNDGNHNLSCNTLKRLRLNLKEDAITGLQCIYETHVGPLQGQSANDDEFLNVSSDENSPNIGFLHGQWNKNGVLKTVTISSMFEKVSLEDENLSFTLKVPEDYKLIGLHGHFSKEGLVSVGLVCHQEHQTLQNPKDLKSLEKFDEVGKDCSRDVIATAYKYFQNVLQNPCMVKYRSFKFPNKIFDTIVSSGALPLLYRIGFQFFVDQNDLMMTIPVGADLNNIERSFNSLLKN